MPRGVIKMPGNRFCRDTHGEDRKQDQKPLNDIQKPLNDIYVRAP